MHLLVAVNQDLAIVYCLHQDFLLTKPQAVPREMEEMEDILGRTSSPTTLFMCWKEIFQSEDATRFDLVDEVDTFPAKMPTNMYQFASWPG